MKSSSGSLGTLRSDFLGDDALHLLAGDILLQLLQQVSSWMSMQQQQKVGRPAAIAEIAFLLVTWI